MAGIFLLPGLRLLPGLGASPFARAPIPQPLRMFGLAMRLSFAAQSTSHSDPLVESASRSIRPCFVAAALCAHGLAKTGVSPDRHPINIPRLTLR